jgi:hypothetical protein
VTDGGAGGATVRVATWNLWWRFGEWRDRRAAIAAELRRVRPDGCGLQEVWSDAEGDRASSLAAELGWHCAFAPSPAPERWQRRLGAGGEGVGVGTAVLSRWPIAAREAADSYWPLWTAAAHTGCRVGELVALTWADLTLPPYDAPGGARGGGPGGGGDPRPLPQLGDAGRLRPPPAGAPDRGRRGAGPGAPVRGAGGDGAPAPPAAGWGPRGGPLPRIRGVG